MTDSDSDKYYQLNKFLGELDLKYKATFVPFSKSRNANNKNQSINWKIFIKGWETDYSQGVGHLPDFQHFHKNKYAKKCHDDFVSKSIEDGFAYDLKNAERHSQGVFSREIKIVSAKTAAKLGQEVPDWKLKANEVVKLKLPIPNIRDVMYCLVSDCDVLDCAGYEDWCADFGYNPDSRKDHALYLAVVDSALQLRARIGGTAIEKLKELYQDY